MYLFNVSTPNRTVIRKVNSDSTTAWMTALSFKPTGNGLSIDNGENNIYLANSANPAQVIILNAYNGAFSSAQN